MSSQSPKVKRKRRQTYKVICAFNDNVQFTIITTFKPIYCPGCGKRATVTRLRNAAL